MMASGHVAGMQSGSQFGQQEREIKRKKDSELSAADPSLSGEQAETIYRDRHGKKLDMLGEFMRQQAIKDGAKLKIEKAQYEWGKGSVQKEEAQAYKKELEEIAAEPFARTADNPRLEAYKKDLIRDDDPMAQFFREKQEKKQAEEARSTSHSGADGGQISKPKKPLYSGPTPPPNRFKIRPGYRWDAVDRGNGFEHKVLTHSNNRNSLKEDEYLWSVQDM
jgi:pre-mRNA-splicing factor CWC26